jgi:hypothetical protein
MRIHRAVLTIVILTGISCASPAAARDASGARWFLRAPSSTRPAFAPPGGRITVDVAAAVYNNCSCAFHVFLLTPDGKQVELYNARAAQPADATLYRFSATVPADTAPGLYDVILRKGPNNDAGKRALAVLPPEDAPLRIMHISLGAAPDLTLAEAAKAANDTIQPDLIIITGVPATAIHEPDRGAALLETIDRFTVPTIVQPPANEHDPLNELLGPSEDVICAGGVAFALFQPDPKTGAAPESVTSAIAVCGPDAMPVWLPSGDNATKFKSNEGITLIDAENKEKAETLSSKTIFATPPLQEGFVRVMVLSGGEIANTELIKQLP